MHPTNGMNGIVNKQICMKYNRPIIFNATSNCAFLIGFFLILAVSHAIPGNKKAITISVANAIYKKLNKFKPT